MTDPQQAVFQDRRSPQNLPCADHERRVSLMEQNAGHLGRTMEAVNTKLDLILAQITKVAILEEKHSNLMVDTDRAHVKITKLSEDVADLAKETRAFINYSQGRDRVLWAIGTAVLVLGIKVVFFAAHAGMTP